MFACSSVLFVFHEIGPHVAVRSILGLSCGFVDVMRPNLPLSDKATTGLRHAAFVVTEQFVCTYAGSRHYLLHSCLGDRLPKTERIDSVKHLRFDLVDLLLFLWLVLVICLFLQRRKRMCLTVSSVDS